MNWKADFIEDCDKNQVVLRIWKEVGSDQYDVLAPIMRDGQIVWGVVKVQEGETAPAALVFSRMLIKNGILDCLATELSNWGARVKEDANKATVGAMSNHLSDLQSLLFGSDTVQINRRGAVEVPDAGV